MGIGNIANTGMRAAMTNMEVISNNIANSDTVGFKKSSASFGDIYANSSGSSTNQPGLGVQLISIDQNFNPGGTTATGLDSDLMLSKEGFFVMQDSAAGQTSYTRNGHFDIDANGYLTNTLGSARVQGFPASNGMIVSSGTLSDIQIDRSSRPATASANVDLELNLDSRSLVPVGAFSNADTSTYNYKSNSTLFDSLGNKHSLDVYYIKTANNEWDTQIEVDGTNIGAGTASFNSSGALTGTTNMSGLTFNPGLGATNPQTITIAMAGSTQFAAESVANKNSQDGYPIGNYTTYQIDSSGNVTSLYSNSERVLIAKVAVAQFQSQSGLGSIGNMSWVETGDSGAPILNAATGDNSINSGKLELSNVDLTQEMIDLIGAQHSFQANAQVEQVYNEVMQTVIKI